MLRAEHITCSVGEKKLLDDVSVEFHAGKFNLIIGPNGAGKSTLIKALSNLEPPKEGSIFYGEKNAKKIEASSLSKIRAVLSQNISISFPLRVAEVVMMGRYPHFTGTPTPKDLSACEEALRHFDVWEMRDRDFTTLSGGEKQRVQFARVLSQIWFSTPGEYRYLLLDEPLTFLDIRYQLDLMNKLKEMLHSKDLVVAGVVHDLNLAAKYADHLILLHEGKVFASGDKENVLTKENIQSVFGISPTILRHGSNMVIAFE